MTLKLTKVDNIIRAYDTFGGFVGAISKNALIFDDKPVIDWQIKQIMVVMENFDLFITNLKEED